MSNLIILYPDIPQAATRFIAASSFSGTANENEDWPAYNTFRGARWQLWKTTSNATAQYLTYDLGPSVTKSVNFLVLSRLDILYNTLNVALDINYSDDGTSFSSGYNEAAISNLYPFSGPYSNDAYGRSVSIGAHRYWQIKFSNAASFALSIGKIYFGTAFDPGVDPDSYTPPRLFDSKSIFNTSGGTLIKGKSDLPRYEFEITWQGLTDAKISSFFDDIYAKRLNTNFFLYTNTYHDVLNGNRLVHCALTEATATHRHEKSNFNNLTCKFLEVLG